MENTIVEVLKIPAKNPIIVEVKNISKYKAIVESIRKKKKLMNKLGFNAKLFYFIGIIKGIDSNEERKNK